MVSIITTNDGSQYKKPTALTTGIAIMAGSTVQGIPQAIGIPISTTVMNKMKTLNKNIDTVEITKAMDKALEMSGMKAKGVKIFKFSPKNNKSMNNVIADFVIKMKKIMKKPANPKKPLKPVNLLNNLMLNLIRNGHNAGFNPSTNAVYINPQKLGTSAFHEIGHAINLNSSKFWRGMQILRMPAMIIASALPLIALSKRKKTESEEPTGFFDKTTTFIKDNVGKLTTLAFAPIVAEELMASARENKLAKQILNPEMVKAVVKSNRYGAITYIATGVLAGAGAYLANKVRDYIASPKKIE